jgi:DNA primase
MESGTKVALDLSKIDVYEFLNELGMNNIREDGKDIWYSCFSDQHYRGDANPSASMEKGTTRFYCFSCGMHGNAVSFLAELENVSPIQSSLWIRERFIGTMAVPDQSTILDNVQAILNNPKKDRSRNGSKSPVLEENEVQRRALEWRSESAWLKYSGDLIDASDTPVVYMLERGFTPEVLNKFQIGWDKISERICIPVRNEDGELLGFKARSLDGLPRYIVLGGPEYGFEPYETRKVLFALDKYEPNFKGEMIVCEGELNAIALHQHGYTNAVGISGKFISEEQVELIIKHGQSCVLIFDEVDDAITAAKKLRSKIPTRIIPEHDKDPADCDATELEWLLQSAKSSLISLT